MDEKISLEEIEKTLTELQEENTTVPVLVEGEKDVAALRTLELTGEIIRFNTGQSVSDFCDKIAQQHRKIIMLTDWDWRGGRLCQQIKKHLEYRVEVNLRYRSVFAQRCPCRTVEGLPSWIMTLRKKIRGA
jgi:5S rRNA maturation endonuclease (ribonuclease M5)